MGLSGGRLFDLSNERCNELNDCEEVICAMLINHSVEKERYSEQGMLEGVAVGSVVV